MAARSEEVGEVLAMTAGTPMAWAIAIGTAVVLAVSAELKDRRR